MSKVKLRDKEEKKKYAKLVTKIRDHYGLSEEEMAKRMQVTLKYYRYIQTTGRVPVNNYMVLCESLNLNTGKILTEFYQAMDFSLSDESRRLVRRA